MVVDHLLGMLCKTVTAPHFVMAAHRNSQLATVVCGPLIMQWSNGFAPGSQAPVINSVQLRPLVGTRADERIAH